MSLPGYSNNPVERFEEEAEHRRWLLQERTGGPDNLRTALRLWDGPLDGQFLALEEGPEAAEAVQAPPRDLAQGLAQDLDLLLGLAELTRQVLYGGYGSESDFNVVPIILEPRLTEAPPSEPSLLTSGVTSLLQPPLQETSATAAVLQEMANTRGAGWDGSSSGRSSGNSDGWWSLEAAMATPLSWKEVAASLGLVPELASRVVPPQHFDSQEAFLSHVMLKHISKLEGGEEEGLNMEEDAAAAAEERGAPTEPRVILPPKGAKVAAAPAGPAAIPAAAAAASCSDSALQPGEGREVAGTGIEHHQQQQQPTGAAAMAAAMRALSEAVVFPGGLLQVVLGSEELGWNPIPLLWLSSAQRAGPLIRRLGHVMRLCAFPGYQYWILDCSALDPKERIGSCKLR
ncbi:hypothetical protein VOLCADRAFT_94475 [Volvox carteri f. nagariensis]|uniref:Uncharacterized protein n=1 Tax=Volvox carteri f. nagariensis TaxID=3068 RepID=D8U4W6_VOLCA|nr:uncharacterized protein VOLCADRAFT_94475 [Volvox carteri f. nagariensis]EFJ45345.1 hypothetical protein VOLCADRAFT_94475 [Volvox carteri f. nagariensis]|eukprot:XP_002953721.1 hypothetical protein VOLCADRAFT_94475 [Volvox carteri f. nagariensis]